MCKGPGTSGEGCGEEHSSANKVIRFYSEEGLGQGSHLF